MTFSVDFFVLSIPSDLVSGIECAIYFHINHVNFRRDTDRMLLHLDNSHFSSAATNITIK